MDYYKASSSPVLFIFIARYGPLSRKKRRRKQPFVTGQADYARRDNPPPTQSVLFILFHRSAAAALHHTKKPPLSYFPPPFHTYLCNFVFFPFHEDQFAYRVPPLLFLASATCRGF